MIRTLYTCYKCQKTITEYRAWIPVGECCKAPVCAKCFDKLVEENKQKSIDKNSQKL